MGNTIRKISTVAVSMLSAALILSMGLPAAVADDTGPQCPKNFWDHSVQNPDVTITYYRKTGATGNDVQTLGYKYGCHIIGVGSHLTTPSEAQHDYEIGNPSGGFLWTRPGDGFLDKFRASNNMWNTQADMKGTFYRGYSIIDETYPKTMNLYAQWVSILDAPNISKGNFTPQIYLNGKQGYETDQTALPVSQEQTLYYKATLDPTQGMSDDDLRLLWGRADKFILPGDKEYDAAGAEQHPSYLEATFDGRLKLNPYTVTFDSKWLKPADGVQYMVNDKGAYVISSDQVQTGCMVKDDGSCVYTLKLPIMMDRDRFEHLTFDQLKEQMVLTIAEDQPRGLNAVLSRESFNYVGMSDKPVITVGGGINLNVLAKISSSTAPSWQSIGQRDASPQKVLVVPTGKVLVQNWTGTPQNRKPFTVPTCGLEKVNDPSLFEGQENTCAYDSATYNNALDHSQGVNRVMFSAPTADNYTITQIISTSTIPPMTTKDFSCPEAGKDVPGSSTVRDEPISGPLAVSFNSGVVTLDVYYNPKGVDPHNNEPVSKPDTPQTTKPTETLAATGSSISSFAVGIVVMLTVALVLVGVMKKKD